MCVCVCVFAFLIIMIFTPSKQMYEAPTDDLNDENSRHR